LRVFWVNGNPNPNFGGTELHTVSMLKHLKDFFDITLICAKGSFVDKNTDFVRKLYIPFPHSLTLPSMIKLYRAISSEKPDIVVANNGKEYPDVLYCGKLAGSKVFFFRHMSRMREWAVRKFVFPFVDKFLAVSEHVRQNLIREGVPPQKVEVVYNIIEEDRFKATQKPKNGRLKVLFVGKLDEGKGVFDLAKACLGLLKKGYPIECIFVGNGRAEADLKAMVQGYQENFLFVGYTPEVEKYYAQAHVCVIPSKGEEAFPRVALEALISGCALVVSDSGGQKEAVIEGFNGYIFERGNPEALKEKLSLALENWETFSQNSQKLYWEKFSAQRTINKILDIFTR
jgi:glycosyltransferase involved in cell wall biosynthesis